MVSCFRAVKTAIDAPEDELLLQTYVCINACRTALLKCAFSKRSTTAAYLVTSKATGPVRDSASMRKGYTDVMCGPMPGKYGSAS